MKIEIQKEIMKNLERKVIKNSKKCHPDFEVGTLRFKRFARAVDNYENMQRKIIDEIESKYSKLSRRSIPHYYPHLNGAGIYEIIKQYSPIKLNDAIRSLN